MACDLVLLSLHNPKSKTPQSFARIYFGLNMRQFILCSGLAIIGDIEHCMFKLNQTMCTCAYNTIIVHLLQLHCCHAGLRAPLSSPCFSPFFASRAKRNQATAMVRQTCYRAARLLISTLTRKLALTRALRARRLRPPEVAEKLVCSRARSVRKHLVR